MSKSNMSGMPGVGAMTDTLEFVRNMWGGMKIPGMAMPSLSVDEVNKQIADLKAVESWLTLNMNMLRGTIQALEVQSATLSTLQSMSESMTSMVKPSAPDHAADDNPAFSSAFSFGAPAAEKPQEQEKAEPPGLPLDPGSMVAPFANPAAWWNMLQDQFKQAVNTAMVPESESKAAPAAPAKTRAKARTAAAAPRKRKTAAKS